MKELLPSAYSESRTPLTDNPTSSHVIVGYVPVGVWLCWFSALVFLSCTISVCSSTRLALNLMFDKVSICFCRQQDNRKSPPQSPAKYVKTMVRVVVGDAICFLCVRISWKKPKHTEFIAHRTVAVSVLANYCIACKKKMFSWGRNYCCKKIGINCTVGQGRPRWSASEKQIVADGSTFDYMYGLMD